MDIEISDINVDFVNQEKLKARINLTVSGWLRVVGLKVIKSNQGLFVAWPNKKNENDNFVDVAFPVGLEVRRKVEELVLAHFEDWLERHLGISRMLFSELPNCCFFTLVDFEPQRKFPNKLHWKDEEGNSFTLACSLNPEANIIVVTSKTPDSLDDISEKTWVKKVAL